MNKKSRQPALIVLSVVALLNVIVVPVFDVWGGLFAKNATKFTFFHVIESIAKDPDNWNLWVVQITLSILLPSIFMLIFSLVGTRKLFITSTIVGIVLWFRIIVQFISQKGVSYVFDFDDCSISIGTWIAIILYIICFAIAISSKKKINAIPQAQPSHSTVPNIPIIKDAYIETDNILPIQNHIVTKCPNCGEKISSNNLFCGSCGQKVENVESEPSIKQISFCPQCGTEIKGNISFCGKCGHKLVSSDTTENNTTYVN